MYWFRSQAQERSDVVTQTVAHFRFPTRAQLSEQTSYADPSLFKAFWFMYASSYGMRNYLKKHAPIHYVDAATNTVYRFDESGFVQKPKGIVVGLLHELEDLGLVLAGKKEPTHYLPAAYVAIGTAHQLLAEETGIDIMKILYLLTNSGGMIFEPVKKYSESKVKPGEEFIVSPKDLVTRLDRTYEDFSIGQEIINGFYDRLIKRWQHVQKLLTRPKHKYLPPEERKYINDILGEFISKTQARIEEGDTLGRRSLEEAVGREYEKVRALINGDGIKMVDIELVLPEESRIILSAKQTIYERLYLPGIMNGSLDYAGLEEDPAVIKNLDARDNAARIGPALENIRNQFIKYTALLEKDAEAINERRRRVLPYQELEQSKDFLYHTLKDAIETERDNLRRKVEDQTQYKDDHDRLIYMAKLMPDLGRIIGIKHTLGEAFKRGIMGLAERAHLI